MKLIKKKLGINHRAITKSRIVEERKVYIFQRFVSSNRTLLLFFYSSLSDPDRIVHQGEVSRASAN